MCCMNQTSVWSATAAGAPATGTGPWHPAASSATTVAHRPRRPCKLPPLAEREITR
jgi:hypothetical protein